MDFNRYKPAGLDTQTFNRLLEELLQTQGEARRALLDDIRVDQGEVATALADLLARIEDAGDSPLGPLLSTDEALATARNLVAPPTRELDWERLDVLDHRVIRRLGEGRMGWVYLVYDQDLERLVALKVLKDTDPAAPRREGHVLARLNHPAIAKIYRRGRVGPRAAPRNGIFMEYVDGIPVTTWCDRRGYTLNARIQLFLRLCEGMAHAHIRGVVHGDLKPAHLLVADEHAETLASQPEPVVKIIDFGIAQLGDDTQGPTSIFGTPPYMAPEQMQGAGDPRSDVYALGVILFELITGVPHPDWQQIKTMDRDARLEALNKPHGKASDVLSAMGEALPEITRDRGANPDHYLKAVRGDLDLVLEKATARDPEQRYERMEALIQDLGHILSHRPISIKAEKRMYRTRLFLRRHAIGATLTTLVTALIIGLLGLNLFQQRELAVEKEQRLIQLEQKAQIFVFFYELLRQPGTSNKGPNVKFVDVIHANRQKLEGTDQPELAAGTLLIFGGIMEGMDLLDQAEADYRNALKLNALLQQDQWRARAGLARLARKRSDYDAALAMYEQLLSETRNAEDAEVFRLQLQIDKASVYLDQEDFDHAARLGRPVRNTSLQMLGPDHASSIRATELLAKALLGSGRSDQALNLLQDSLEAKRLVFPDDHAKVAETHQTLANLYLATGRLNLAEDHYRQALKVRTDRFNLNHPLILNSRYGLARVALARNQFDQAAQLAQAVADQRTELTGPNHHDTLMAQNVQAIAMGDAGDTHAAIALLQDVHDRFTQTQPNHPEHLRVMNNLAHFLVEAGHFDQAEDLLEETLRLKQTRNHQKLWPTYHTLGEAFEKQGCLEEAAGLFLLALEDYRQREHPAHREVEFLSSYARALAGTQEREAARSLILLCLERMPEGEPADSLHQTLARLQQSTPAEQTDR